MTINRLSALCLPASFASALAVLTVAAVAQTAPPRAPVPPPPPLAAPALPALQAIAPPANVLERIVTGAGVRTCLNAVRALGPALTGPENAYAAMLMTNPAAPNGSAFTASIERVEPNGTRFVSAFFAPTPKGGCDVSYDMVDVWRKSCQDVAVQDLKYTQPLNVVGLNVSIIPYSATHHVYLIRTPGGCVSISKEMLYP